MMLNAKNMERLWTSMRAPGKASRKSAPLANVVTLYKSGSDASKKAAPDRSTAYPITSFGAEGREGRRKRKPRLAIVSTFDDLCGIAGYTRFLSKSLENDFDISVFDLDQFFMRSNDPRVRKIADGMVKEFCATAGQYDYVNIQLEYGILGQRKRDILKRFMWVANAAPALSVTFHTIVANDQLDLAALWLLIAKWKWVTAGTLIYNRFMSKTTDTAIYGTLRRLSKIKPVNVIVHTRRDRRILQYIHRLPRVVDHPLTFLSEDLAKKYRHKASRSDIAGLGDVPDGAKLIGVFGFLSPYKGFHTVVRALHLLPSNYYVLFFGGLHPNEIKKQQVIHPYVQQLLDEAYVGKTVFDSIRSNSVSIAIDKSSTDLLFGHPGDVSQRLRFLGSQTDEGFARGMAICDVVVLPYLEVGQSASGPMSIALEMDARIIAARNHAFMQFTRYHPNSIELFEIGNYVELASKILSDNPYPAEQRPRTYNATTSRELYLQANGQGARRQDSSGLGTACPQSDGEAPARSSAAIDGPSATAPRVELEWVDARAEPHELGSGL